MKNKQRGFTLIELMSVVALFVWLAVIVGLVWAAVHFISKYW